MKSILMWLEGPLQSWGVDSQFDRRETLEFPTLSGVCGLLCAALGEEGDARSLLSRLVKANPFIQSYTLKGQETPEILRDFHMIGSGYDGADPWQFANVPKTINGKKPTAGVTGSKLTYRFYLLSQAFAVIFTYEDDDFAQQVYEALCHPKWALFLGRRNCAPSEVIAQGIFDSAEKASNRAEEIASEKNRVLSFEVINGRDETKGDVIVLNDIPIQFGIHKVYQSRYVTIIKKAGDECLQGNEYS